jgi:glycosyltransferase involved in cell wall biosynthesis
MKVCSKDFDIVHCHDFDTLPLGYILSRQKSAKLVYDAHESYVDMLGNIPKWLKVLICQVENILLRRTDLLITVGEILREDIAKRGAKNTCVVGNWKEPEKFKFPRQILKKEKKRLNIADGQLVVSFIANLGLERQLPQLIEAVKDMPDTFLMVGGNGPCRKIVENADYSYTNIHYLGYVNPKKVPFYTAMSDVVFYGFDPQNPNSRFSAPNKLFEALAAGKPVISGDFGEIGRIVRVTQSGRILNTYSTDEIKKALSLLSNSAALERFAEKARNAGLNKYCWDKAHLILLRKYEGIAK